MRYYEICENAGIDAFDALKYNVHKLITLYKGTIPNIMKEYNMEVLHVDDQYKKGKQNGDQDDMSRAKHEQKVMFFRVGKAKSDWFHNNYLTVSTARKGDPYMTRSGLKNALINISKMPSFRNDSNLANLAHMEVNIDGTDVSHHMKLIELKLPDILDKIGEIKKDVDFKSMAKELKHWFAEYHKNKQIIELPSSKGKEEKPKDNTGQQNQQVDQLINHVLSQLDKKVAAELRPIIARSDNKLQTLQKELAKRNIKM